MTEFETALTALIKAAVMDTEPTVSVNLNYRKLYDFAEKQQIVAMLYSGVFKMPGFEADPASQLFFERYCMYLGHNADQLDTVEQIFQAFEEAGISYMPVKGTLLKTMYPSPEMRTMADADILIRMEEYDRIKPIMLKLGCTPDYESDHEYSWNTATGLQIELHKRLIPTYNKDYYAYYGDGWKWARPCEGSRYRFEMSPEDMFVFLFTHFAKHYRDQGVGIKYVVDFYVFMQKHPKLDFAYIEHELEKLQLQEFYENIMYLLKVWFDGAPSTDLIDYLTNRIFYDGVFGRSELSVISEGLKLSKSTKTVKAKKKRQLFFPPFSVMRIRYPILNKLAILLPILWMVRLVDLAINHRDRYRRRMDRLARMSDENISEYQRELNYVGLDYNFGGDDPPTKKE